MLATPTQQFSLINNLTQLLIIYHYQYIVTQLQTKNPIANSLSARYIVHNPL